MSGETFCVPGVVCTQTRWGSQKAPKAAIKNKIKCNIVLTESNVMVCVLLAVAWAAVGLNVALSGRHRVAIRSAQGIGMSVEPAKVQHRAGMARVRVGS